MKLITSLSRCACRLFTVSTLLFSAASVRSQELNPGGQPFPDVRLNAPARGEALANAYGKNLAAVGAWYGKTAAELRGLISQDASLRGDARGRLFYVCDGPPAPGAPAAAGDVTVTAGPFPVDQTFLLHSRPGAPRVIYLDFNGHVTSGTFWNSSYEDGANFTTPPYDIDGNTAAFSATELDRIQYIWQRVAEDFAPFEVDVTTEDPGVEGLRKSTTSDPYYGVRVCIGGSSMDWFGSSAGGVAYLGSFTWNTDTPCYVFTAQLGTGHEKYTAEAISHEAGHTFNLHHDGKTDGTAYYQGHGNWAPIMGVGYYEEVVQWSKGEYPLANNTEDDVAMIASYVGYRTDDHGGLLSSATPLIGPGIYTTGLIERSTDIDVFSFNTGTGPVSFTLNCAPRSPNLDALLSLYDGLGNLITSVNGTGIGATITTSLSAGTYYLSLDGVGVGDLVTGYSDYASLGQYTLTGSVVSTGNQPPVASASGLPTSGYVPLTVAFSSAGSSDPDGTISVYDWDFGDGGGSNEASPTHIYTSVGNYTATLVVQDNGGLSSSLASVAIAVNPPPNLPPVAVAGATPLSGYAPLNVSFSGSGSSDQDGSIVTYSWNFGDGTSSTAVSPSHTYNSPGTFTARLTVTDNRGGTGTADVTVLVSQDPNKKVIVSNIVMSLVSSPSGNSGRAIVTVKDAQNNARPGAVVTGSWSGLTTGTVTGTTDSSGNVAFTSKKTRKTGTFTFTVTGVSASGYVYDPSVSVKTGSISNP